MADFIRKGKSRLMFAPAVANKAAPTRAEITAATQLSIDLRTINGMTVETSRVTRPNLAELFTPTRKGEKTTEATSLVMYDNDTTHTVRDVLAEDTEGFLIYMPYGDVPAERCEVWPVVITGNNDDLTIENELARYIVSIGVTSTPEQDAVIPAAV